jgi:hypothetical protein
MSSKKTKKDKKTKAGTGTNSSGYDVFNNPMVTAAINALSPEDLDKYRKIGEQMYGTIDFEGAHALNNMPAPMGEAVAYVLESLKSGLHPSMLDEDEKALLLDTLGDKWWEKYGYVEGDLTEIVTTAPKA